MQTKLLTIVFGLFTLLSFSQIVNIPDANFKQRLIDDGVDQTGDGEIQVGEAEAVTVIDLRNAGITDLTGIEAFIHLHSLDINNLTYYENFNSISYIDLTSNQDLEYINAQNVSIENMDISSCYLLKELHIENNQLTALDISNNAELLEVTCQNNMIQNIQFLDFSVLGTLDCSFNQLVELDISTQTYLVDFLCNDNELSLLNISNSVNQYFSNFNATGNALTCVTVDDENNVPQIIQDGVDAGVAFSNNCALGNRDDRLESVNVYPNPVHDFLIIDLPDSMLKKMVISDVLGKIVLSLTKPSQAIEVSKLPKGVYFIRILDAKGRSSTQKISKE